MCVQSIAVGIFVLGVVLAYLLGGFSNFFLRRPFVSDAVFCLVLMMTVPGLALFYAGMVRKKNVLATMAQSLAAVALISVLWIAFGYSLAFVGDGPWIGTLERVFFVGMTMDSVNPAAKTIPEALFAGLDRRNHRHFP